MTHSHHPFETQSEREASLWAAKLDDASLSRSESEELQSWMNKDPLHRQLLSEYCQLGADLEQSLPLLLASGGLSVPRKKPSLFTSQKVRWMGVITLAAAALIVLGLWISRPATEERNSATALAQRQSLTLKDGTRIDLNARTSLRVEVSATERRVHLADGQAYFEVRKDLTRPFIVVTSSGSIRVTGTKFEVRTDTRAECDVMVVEGSVEVQLGADGDRGKGPAQMLKTGDKLTNDARGKVFCQLTPEEIEDALAWRQGQIVFNQVSLKDALPRLARYHGRVLRATAAAGELRLGGRFSLENLDGFLDALEKVLHVRINKDSDGIVTISLRSES